MDEKFVLAPASLPQEQFLASTSTITLYSGAMGAGKSYAIVLNMVKFAAMRNSTIVCFRRTQPELRAPGGIWQEATTIFRIMFKDCKIRHRDLEIYIPSTNSVVKFQSLQYQSDVDKALGAQYSAIFFDEAVTFEPFEQFILPLLGRLRNAGVQYTPQMFWATNPKFDNGIYHWIKDFYLDENGIPLKEKSNVERWFTLKNNKPIWFDNKEDAETYCGTIPVPPGQPKVKPRSFKAIRAVVYDNIPLMRNNPDYAANLQALPDVRRRIYLYGSWTARLEESGIWKREWCPVVQQPNLKARRRVRAYDLAGTLPSPANPDPDWTRGVLISKDEHSTYTVEDMVSIRDRFQKVEQLIFDTAYNDGKGVTVVLPCDPNAQAGAWARTMQRKLGEMGFSCKLVRPQQSKGTRFAPFSTVSQSGFVQVVQGNWYSDFCTELEEFTPDKKNQKDDIVDCCSDAMYILNKGASVPTGSFTSLDTTYRAPSFSFSSSQPSAFLPTFNI